jgi:hypothetical protein
MEALARQRGDDSSFLHRLFCLELLGFAVHPEHAPSRCLGYLRIAHLLAPLMTSAVKRPLPSGVMTAETL